MSHHSFLTWRPNCYFPIYFKVLCPIELTFIVLQPLHDRANKKKLKLFNICVKVTIYHSLLAKRLFR